MSRALAVAAATIALLAGASSALAQPTEHNPKGKMLGVVEPRGHGSKTGGGGLLYHSGPVMHTNTTYTVFWGPAGSFDPTYVSLINRFFADVAAASGTTTNVYDAGTQYSDLTGPVTYGSTFGGSYADTNPYPASGCRDRYTPTCLSDAQIQDELQHSVMPAKSWSGGLDHVFFVFTPTNVGSCAGGSCAFSSFCAYHSWIGSGASAILYANMPYADFVPGACDSGQHPNGNPADATIDGASHEHNEAITDPLGSAWFTKNGAEQGDLCNFNYGPPAGGVSPAEYNQTIAGNHYWIQQEWSNHSSACVQQGI